MPEVKTEIETAIAEAKTAVEGGDPDTITAKTNALAQSAMKLGEAMYKAQQAETEAAAGPDAGTSGPTEEQPAAEEDVVDAEFSEVDDEQKQG